jgi:hypothetical protein
MHAAIAIDAEAEARQTKRGISILRDEDAGEGMIAANAS